MDARIDPSTSGRDQGDLVDLRAAGGDEAVVTVEGEVDLQSSPQLRAELRDVIESGARRVIVDLSRLEFIDSSGLGVLVGAHQRLLQTEGELVLRGVKGSTLRVLETTGLIRVFRLVD